MEGLRVPATGAMLRPALPPDCVEDTAPTETAGPDSVTARWSARCRTGGLVGGEVGVDGLASGKTDARVRVRLADGRLVQGVVRAGEPRLTIPARPGRLDVVRSYAKLGIEHILTGPDHLLFVLGLLLLVGGSSLLVRTITAFTVGHSITLSLAVLGLATVPPRPIEVGIAASVFLLAVELTLEACPRPTLLRRAPWAMAGAFGLLHGLGFAGALAEVGLPAGEIPLALFSFNLGIELGQLAFVAMVALVGWSIVRVLAGRPAWLTPARRTSWARCRPCGAWSARRSCSATDGEPAFSSSPISKRGSAMSGMVSSGWALVSRLDAALTRGWKGRLFAGTVDPPKGERLEALPRSCGRSSVG